MPNVRGTLTVALGKDPKFLGIWALEVWLLVLFLVYFVLFNMCFVTDCICVHLNLPVLEQTAWLQAFMLLSEWTESLPYLWILCCSRYYCT